MKLRSTLCLLLALLMLSPAMASCGNTENETTADTAAGDTAAETETETVDPWLDDLPDSMDLGGRTVNILSRVEGEEMNL